MRSAKTKMRIKEHIRKNWTDFKSLPPLKYTYDRNEVESSVGYKKKKLNSELESLGRHQFQLIGQDNNFFFSHALTDLTMTLISYEVLRQKFAQAPKYYSISLIIVIISIKSISFAFNQRKLLFAQVARSLVQYKIDDCNFYFFV